MKKLVFYLVDVFSLEKYSGNQLAVIRGADSFSDQQMQKIANEMHFSETTFIMSERQKNDTFNVRIFTPSTEVPFAGHPTIGTAYIIRHFVTKNVTEQIILKLKAGEIPVTFENQDGNDILWMKQLPPVFGKTFPVEQFRTLLGLQISDFDCRCPIQEVSTGLPFIIVPIKSLDAIKRARINQIAMQELIKQTATGILVFSQETYSRDNQLNARVFVDAFGISEDPATGSGNGCLAAYLVQTQFLGDQGINIRVEQGFEIDRPSILHLRAKKENNKIEVHVGGKVYLVAKGELL